MPDSAAIGGCDMPLPYRAVIVDFDRTLLHTDKTLSAYTVQVLRSWQEAGARLFAATARPERAITAYCQAIAFDAVTTLNGARTITRSAVFESPITERSAAAILNQLGRVKGLVISAETDEGIYANTDIPDWAPAVIDSIQELPGRNRIYKILASHPHMPADQLVFRLPEDTYSTIADQSLIQIMSRGATKWNGICKMLAAYQIDRTQAVYFGDDNDDLEPIRCCGCGVAVSNALERVRASADDIALSNDEDGVARYLAERLPRKKP